MIVDRTFLLPCGETAVLLQPVAHPLHPFSGAVDGLGTGACPSLLTPPGHGEEEKPTLERAAYSPVAPTGGCALLLPSGRHGSSLYRTPSPALPNVLEVAVNHDYPYLLGQPRMGIDERRQPDSAAVILAISPTRLTPLASQLILLTHT